MLKLKTQELAQFGAVYVNFVSAVSAELEFAESTTSVLIENNAV